MLLCCFDGCCSEDVVVLLMGVVVKMLSCRVVDGCCSEDVVHTASTSPNITS